MNLKFKSSNEEILKQQEEMNQENLDLGSQ